MLVAEIDSSRSVVIASPNSPMSISILARAVNEHANLRLYRISSAVCNARSSPSDLRRAVSLGSTSPSMWWANPSHRSASLNRTRSSDRPRTRPTAERKAVSAVR